MGEHKKISDFISIELLQSIQDKCSKAMGLGFVTVDYRGHPITNYSGFTDHCALGRELRGFSEMCEQCDAHGGLHATITGQPYIYRCHAGLIDFAVPLILDDVYMGAVMGGQVRLADAEERELEYMLPRINWNKSGAMETAYGQLREMTYDKLLASVQVVRDMILYAMQNQRKQDTGQASAEERLDKQERSSLDQEHNALWQEEADQLFFIVNLITQMAYREGANRTGTIAQAFSDIMRYVEDPGRTLSTLQEELNCAEAFLSIQKAWWGDKLDYSIAVPKQYWGISCPFLAFRPIVGMILQSFKSSDVQRIINISTEESSEDILILVRANSERSIPEEMANRAEEYLARKRTSLQELNRNLIRVMGKRCKLSIDVENNSGSGYTIQLKLPIKWK